MTHQMRLVSRWLGLAVVASTALRTAAQAVLTLTMDGLVGFVDSLPMAPTAIAAGLIWSLVACLLYGPVLATWPLAARRWPRIETSRSGFLVATGLLALPPMIVAPPLAAGFPFGSSDYFREFLIWLVPVSVMSWGGLAVPRFLVSSLRLGLFVAAAS